MQADHPSPWREELTDILRGVSGAMLFGAPLLYTMEVWWKGGYTPPAHMLFSLALTYTALVALNRTIGFRRQHDTTLVRTLADSAEALALGLLTATLSLLLLRRLSPDLGLNGILGRIILESVPFSLGVGIASGLLHQASGDEGDDDAQSSEDEAAGQQGWRGTLADMGGTILGAAIISFSIAPTDEVPMLAQALSPPWLLALVVVSLVVSYTIVFEAEFGAQDKRRQHQGIFQSPVSETVISYLLSLLFALAMLLFFQTLRVGDPWPQWVTYTLILGLPATIGGSAGRLAL
jgi:putative integral membrane protein (TIGR02587 family)